MAAARGNVSLWLDRATGLCEVRGADRTGVWRSSPGTGAAIDFWAAAYDSAFILRRLTPDGVIALYTGDASCRKSFRRIEGGVRCDFSFPALGLRLPAEYVLTPRGVLRVRIPVRGIVDPGGTLLDIRVLPYFGHLQPDEEGYAVLPDGCGGVIRPDRRKSQAYQGVRVYGQRFVWEAGRGRRSLRVPGEADPGGARMNLPIFGVVGKGGAMLGVVARGRWQAEIGPEVTPNEFLLSVSPRLILRELAVDLFGRFHAGPLDDRGDRVVEYHFLPSREASYAGLARAYRRLMLAGRGGSRREPRARFRVRLLCGVERRYQAQGTSRLLSFTTFAQAEAILADLHRRGLRTIDVILCGWGRRGYLGDNPSFFPADPAFGGNAGLRRLIAAGRRLGYTVGLEFDNSYAWSRGRGYRRRDTVKDIQGIPVDIGAGRGEYLLCPVAGGRRFLGGDLPRAVRLGAGCLLFDGINRGLAVCHDEGHPCGAPRAAAELARLLAGAAARLPAAAIGLSDLAPPAVNAAYQVPSTCSRLCDQAIPLLPLVFHGLVGYSFEPINQRRNGRQESLKTIEYGAVPEAFLTWRSVELLEGTDHNLLFSGAYRFWRGRVAAEYREYVRRLKELQPLAMVDHFALADGVFLTAYAGGRAVIVNYTGKPYSFRGRSIGPESYAMIDWSDAP